MSVLFAYGKTARSRGGSPAKCRSSRFAETDQRKMPHRRHWPPLGQGETAMSSGPGGPPRPRKCPPPAEPARQGRECEFEGAARAALGANMIDQDQFAAGLQYPDEIIERGF